MTFIYIHFCVCSIKLNPVYLSIRYGQYITGVYFEQGIVVEKDIDIAEQYLLSSAQQGFTDAQAALGILLVDHKENIKEGKHWLEHAAQVVRIFSSPIV